MTQATEPTIAGSLVTFSDELASAVDRAAVSVVRVEARRGSASSGIVWSSAGQILTADHTLEREEDIPIGLHDGRTLRGRLVARDPGTDLALLSVEAHDLAPAELADDAAVRVGHLALAVGRPGPAGVMASLGVVSAAGGAWRTARGGQIDGFIRTDATLYPGFSGGPLIDAAGRVIAVNSWTLSQGAGLAIPTGVAARVAEALAQGGVKRAYLGVGTQVVALPESIRARIGGGQELGLMLVAVEPGAPADKSGLLIGDIVLAVEGQPVRDADELLAQLTSERVGQSVSFRIVRGGEVRDLGVVPGERQ